MTRFLEKERMEGVMDCERSVITMKLFRLDYLVYDLGNYVDDTSTETDLNPCGENKSERIPAPKSTNGRWPRERCPVPIHFLIMSWCFFTSQRVSDQFGWPL